MPVPEPKETIQTPLTKLFGIKHPVILAGMSAASGPELAAAVSNAGGLGVVGGLGYTPEFMERQLKALKAELTHPDLPFGVDLALPQVGGSARKTNYDYTHGQLPELIDVIIKSGAKLFVSAVGVPPKWAIDKLHAAGIPVMNMVGAPKHAIKAIEQGVDIICGQGTEGGGHTGDITTTVLIPKLVDVCKKYTSKFTGQPVHVVGAGGISDGRGLASCLSLGAEAVWVGTRFVCAKEAGASTRHQEAIVTAGLADTLRTLIISGRPLRVRATPYFRDWDENRSEEIKKLTSQGILPYAWETEELKKKNNGELPEKFMVESRPFLMGQVAGNIDDVLPAKEIVDMMVNEAVASLKANAAKIIPVSRL